MDHDLDEQTMSIIVLDDSNLHTPFHFTKSTVEPPTVAQYTPRRQQGGKHMKGPATRPRIHATRPGSSGAIQQSESPSSQQAVHLAPSHFHTPTLNKYKQVHVSLPSGDTNNEHTVTREAHPDDDDEDQVMMMDDDATYGDENIDPTLTHLENAQTLFVSNLSSPKMGLSDHDATTLTQVSAASNSLSNALRFSSKETRLHHLLQSLPPSKEKQSFLQLTNKLKSNTEGHLEEMVLKLLKMTTLLAKSNPSAANNALHDAKTWGDCQIHKLKQQERTPLSSSYSSIVATQLSSSTPRTHKTPQAHRLDRHPTLEVEEEIQERSVSQMSRNNQILPVDDEVDMFHSNNATVVFEATDEPSHSHKRSTIKKKKRGKSPAAPNFSSLDTSLLAGHGSPESQRRRARENFFASHYTPYRPSKKLASRFKDRPSESTVTLVVPPNTQPPSKNSTPTKRKRDTFQRKTFGHLLDYRAVKKKRLATISGVVCHCCGCSQPSLPDLQSHVRQCTQSRLKLIKSCGLPPRSIPRLPTHQLALPSSSHDVYAFNTESMALYHQSQPRCPQCLHRVPLHRVKSHLLSCVKTHRLTRSLRV